MSLDDRVDGGAYAGGRRAVTCGLLIGSTGGVVFCLAVLRPGLVFLLVTMTSGALFVLGVTVVVLGLRLLRRSERSRLRGSSVTGEDVAS